MGKINRKVLGTVCGRGKTFGEVEKVFGQQEGRKALLESVMSGKVLVRSNSGSGRSFEVAGGRSR